VVRVMSNTPALVQQRISAMAPGSACREEHLAQAESLLRAVGAFVRVPEHRLDAVTAISGSGPAYVFYVVESMIEAGVHLGLPRTTATELVVQTLIGSAHMLTHTQEHPAILREQVTSPAGTTAAALHELDRYQVRASFLDALRAACERSRALSTGL
jgi:pyrroline-5-carboxylate reductase